MSKIQDARNKKANLTERQLKFLQDAVANNASAYEDAANRLNKNYSTVHDTLSDDVYDDRDTRVATQKKLYDIRADEARVDAFNRLFGSGQQKAAPSAYDDLQKYSDALFSTYRPFSNADDYTQYMNLLRYDTDAAQKQIDSLTEQKKNAPWLSKDRRDIGKQIDQLEDEIYRANQIQYPAKVSEYRSNSDFDLYAQRGAQMANPSMQDVFFHPTILGKKIGKQDVVNKVAFGREHADELLIGAANGTAADKEYDYYKYRSMTDDEVATYNYILAKYGTEEADKYLAAMDEELNAREGKGQAQRVGELGNAAELAYMFGSGMESAVQGVRQTFSPELLSTSPSAFGSQIVRESLADDGAGWQIAGDLAMSTGNMLPSIALSAMTGGAGPAVGAATMGLGVYGSTYNQARKDGLTERQASTYAGLVAAAEGGLQYLLGGIGKLGGKLTGNAVSKIVKNIDSAFLRISVSGALKAGGEGLEEGLQEILDPLFKGLATGEIDPEWFSTEDIAYSALLGFLSGGMLEGPSNLSTNVRTMSIGRGINQSDAARQELLDSALQFKDSENKSERSLYDLAYEMTEGKTHQNDFNVGDLAIAAQSTGVDVDAIRKKARTDIEAQKAEKPSVSVPAQEMEKSSEPTAKVAESGFAKSQTGIVETADGNVRVSDISINEVNEDGIILDVTEEDGSIVQRSFDDVEFDDVLAEELFEKAATMDTNTAKAFVMGYDGNVPVSEYTQGFMEIMGAARKGMSLEQIVANGINADVLSPAQRQAAYIAGQNAGRVVDASVSAASVSRGGVVDRTSGLSNTQKRHIDAVDAFAKLIGRRVIIEDRITETPDGVKLSKHVNAYFDPNTNEYHIAKDGIGQAYMFFAVHENIHDIRANNPEAYKKLKGVVFDVLGAERVEAARKIQERLYPNEDADYIDEEIVANTVPAILRDEATAKMMAERVAKADTETRNAFEKLLNGINDLLRKAYNSLRVTASWKQLDSIENDMDAISRIREAYFEALGEKQIRFSAEDENAYSMEDLRAKYPNGIAITPMKSLKKLKFTGDRKSFPSFAYNLVKKNGHYKNTKDKAYISFPSTNTNALVTEDSFIHGRGDYDNLYAKVCLNATAIAQNAIPVNELFPNRHHAGDAIVYMAIAEDEKGTSVVRMIVERGTGVLSGMDVLYTIKKESHVTPSAAAYLPHANGDTAEDGLRKGTKLARVSSPISIDDFIDIVNSTNIGRAVVSADVLQKTGTARYFEPRVTPYLRFSLTDTESVDKTKVRSVSSLEKRLAHAKAQLKLTKGVEVNADRIKSLSRKILRQYESKYKLDTFAENLEKVFRYVANTPEPDLDYVYESLNSVSKAALLQSVTKVEDSRAAELKAYFRGKTIYISDTQKAEIESEYGSMSAFRKMLRGTGIKITTDKQYIGNSLDRNYVEMAEMFPSLFEFNTAEGDQPFALVRAFKSVQPIVENPYGMNIDEAANDMTSELLAAYGDEILAKPTFADKQKARFEEMQQKLKADINAVREETKAEYNKVVEALIEMNDRNVASLEQRVKELEQEKSDLANNVERRIKAEERRKRAAEIDALKAKYKAQIEQLRSDKNRRMLEIQARNVEAVQEARKTVRERMEKTERARTLRGRIRAKVKSLHKLLLNPTDQKHIPDSMEKAVFDFCQLFTETPGVLFSKDKLTRVHEQYSKLSKEKGLDIASYDEDIQVDLEELKDTIGGKSLAELTNDELQKISDIVDNFKHMVSKENKLFIEGRRVEIATIGEKTLDEARNKGMFKRLAILSGEKLDRFRDLLGKGNITPIYFFKQMGGQMQRLYNDIRNGQDKWAVNMTTAKEFITKTKEKFEYAKWANEKDDTLKFVTARGDSITLTREQAMLIYATRKREIANTQQKANHLKGGGIVFKEKQRDGKWVYDDVNKKPLTDGDIATITDWLTDQQKQYADAMVGYMSNEMSALGNEVSLRLYGIRKFTEKYYIPYVVSEEYLHQTPGKETDSRLKHISFTKRTVANANEAIYVTDFTEVCAGHIQSMCMYNAMTVPLENITRVLSYKTRTDDMTTGESVRAAIVSHYGQDTMRYIDTLLKDINGGVRSDTRGAALEYLTSLFKKGAVFMSASVAIQQPSAIGRATALVDTKYFLKSIGMKRDYETVKKYAPVAIVKQMGRFDTGTGLSATDWLMEGSEVGFEKVKKKADDLGGKLPELMDQVTWSRIFNACVAETKDKTGLTGEALMEAAGKRFRDVVDYTQVYDSVLSRSANMRSKRDFEKMVTSFAAEPTVSYNLLMDAVYSAKTGENGGKKYAARAVGAFVLSVTLNAVLKSLVTAARDKDDEESYLEKYVSAVVSNFTQDINPLRLIPAVRDVMSVIFDGYDVERADMALVSDLKDSLDKFTSDNASPWEKWKSVIGSVAAFAGIPAKNIIRDVESAINMIGSIGNSTTAQGIRLAFEEGLGIDNSAKKQAERVIKAQLKGDTKEVAQTIADYRYTLPRDLTEQEANRKVESWLKAEIKRMYVDEKITPDQANELLEELVHLTDTKDLFSLYKAWDWEREGGDSENAPTAYTEIYAIVRNKGDITAEMKKLVDAGYEEAYVRGQIQGQIASWFKGTANDGHARISRTDAKLLLQKYTDKKDSEIDKLINQWQCYVTTGIQYDDIRKEYENGKLTTSRVAEMLRLYGGYTAEDATAKARAWEFFKGNPDYDDISLEAVMKYNQYAKPVGVSVSVFADAVKFKNAAEPDYDSDGNPISKSAQKKVWAYIDKLPISKSQKDALHLSFYAKSTLRKAPWN